MPCYSLGYGVSELSDLVPVQTQHFEDVERSFEVALRNPPNQKLNPPKLHRLYLNPPQKPTFSGFLIMISLYKSLKR